MINEKEKEEFGKKYLEKLEKEEKRKQKERERSKSRKTYFKEWEQKNKGKRKRFLNKKEAEIILKYLPNREETKNLILKLKTILNI